MNFSHCCDNTDEEFRQLAEAGGRATACPSLDMAFGMGDPATGRMRDAGLRAAIGVDSVIAASGDLFEEARIGLLYERIRRADAVFETGVDVKSVDQLAFTAREALEAVTINGAHAIWLDDKVGSLTPGKKADVILLRGTDLNLVPLSDVVGTIICCASRGNVDTVLVDGKVMKRDGKLVGIDVERVRTVFVEARDRLFGYDDYPGMRPAAAKQAAARSTRSSGRPLRLEERNELRSKVIHHHGRGRRHGLRRSPPARATWRERPRRRLEG